MASELDLDARRDRRHQIVAEVVASLVAAGEACTTGSAVDGRTTRGQEAESTGNLELDVLVRRVDDLRAKRPGVGLGADDS